MKGKQIVLLNLYYAESGYGEILHYPPLGIAYISEYLDEKKINHHVIDMGLGYTPTQIIDKLEAIKPFWIAISLNSLEIEKSKMLINKIKEKFPETKIVVGGPHPSTQGPKILSELKNIDYGIVGEAEESFYELVAGQPKEHIKGLVYKNSLGKAIMNERRVTEDINQIPFPKFKRFELDSYVKKTIPLISSRGCPFKCIFCQQSSLLSKRWRGISSEYFVEIVKYWRKRGYNEIQILDDNFLYDSQRIEKIGLLLEQERINDLNIILVGGVRINDATRKNLLLLRKIGVDFISFGVESYSDRVLRFIRKGISVEQINMAVKNACEIGFKVRLFFIIGFPYQTIESLRETYKFIMLHPVYQVRFFNLIPYENTVLKDWLDANGEYVVPTHTYMNEFKKYQNIPVFKAKNTLTVEEREEELKIARDVERIVAERAKYLFNDSLSPSLK